MNDDADPFRHHPELRQQIGDAETSFFRDFTLDAVLRAHPELEAVRSWAYSDATREALRAEALAGHTGDLWIFAYGSLMWDPALRFAEVRRARLDGYARRLILVDDKGARGTKEAPGLMAALDEGDGCDGLAFRIEASRVEHETEILFRREMVGPGYHARLVPTQIDATTVPALTFVADHATDMICGDITRQQQLTYLATGHGFLGSSHAYLANIVSHFQDLGIEDTHCAALLRDTDALLASDMEGTVPQ